MSGRALDDVTGPLAVSLRFSLCGRIVLDKLLEG